MVPFAQETNNYLTKESLRLRVVIANSKNPVSIFFDEIPRALGFSSNDLDNDEKLEEFTLQLQKSTSDLSAAFPRLFNRLEDCINQTLGIDQLTFPENKTLLQKRFKKVQQVHLKPKLKVLIQRINTPLDDRQSWLSSIATAILNKTPDKFTDEDEKAFKSLFPQFIHELDNISDISQKDIDSDKEEVLKLELTSFVKGVQKHMIRLPKSKSNLIEQKKNSIKTMLDQNDKQANIALLLKLLQEEIEHE